MDGKREAAGATRGAGAGQSPGVAKLAERLDQILIEAANGSIEELERAAKMVGTAAKSGQSVSDLIKLRHEAGGVDEGLDAAGEQHLRERLLGRLDALAKRLEKAGVDRWRS